MKIDDNIFINEKKNTSKNIKSGIEEEQDWVKSIAQKMGVPGRTDLACKALIAVLHFVRDNLDLKQIFQLSAYLPLNIRGIYFEGYDPDNVKVMIYNNQLLISFRERMGPKNSRDFENYLDRAGKKQIDREDLVKTIRGRLKTFKEINPDIAFQAVMEVMYEKIPFEDPKVSNIINVVDLNSEFKTAD